MKIVHLFENGQSLHYLRFLEIANYGDSVPTTSKSERLKLLMEYYEMSEQEAKSATNEFAGRQVYPEVPSSISELHSQ